MRINHNIASLNIAQQLRNSNKRMTLSSTRLSSGVRINSVKDDATGMAISTKLENQERGLGKARENSLNGISLIQTLDGTLSSIHSMVHKMRELSIQASNDTNTTSDREKMQKEVEQLKQEIDVAAKNTSFNNIKLLYGDSERLVYNSEPVAGGVTFVSDSMKKGTLEYTVDKIGKPASLDIEIPSGTVPLGLEGKIFVNGAELNVNLEDTADDIGVKLLKAYDNAGMELIKLGTGKNKLVTLDEGSEEKINIEDKDDILMKAGFIISNLEDGTDAQVTLNGYTDKEFESTAKITTKGNHIEIVSDGGKQINIDLNFTVSESTGQYELNDGNSVGIDVGGGLKLEAKITEHGGIKIQVGQNKDMELDLFVEKIDLKSLGIENLSIGTFIGAQKGIQKLDIAVEKISLIRAKAGAYQNRFEYTIKNLDTAQDNTTIALSRIRDTDMAKEMTEYSKHQVIYQAGISILAQSNQRPQQILQLLG